MPASATKLVIVKQVSCPRHGPKTAYMLPNGTTAAMPFVARQRDIESHTPLCFECKAVGIRRRCVVVMDDAGYADKL